MSLSSIKAGKRELDLEVYSTQNTPSPAILLLHEVWGVRDYLRKDAAELAAKGYLVYLPNLFTGGALKYCIKSLFNEENLKNRASSPLNKEIHDLLDTMKQDPQCNGKIGMLGACVTGGFVLQMAKRDDMAAPVLYHHAYGTEGCGIPNDESLDEVKILQAHFSKVDPFCPAKRRNALKKRLGDRIQAYEYNLPHGFRSTWRHLTEAKTVWKRSIEFFDTQLKNNPSTSTP